MTPIIRPLAREDYHKGYFQILSQLTTCPHMTYDEWLDCYEVIEEYDNILIYVMELENTIIGSGTIVLEDKFIHDGQAVGHIEDIVIDSKHRRHGYGKLIIKYLMEKAQANNCYKVILDCNTNNVSFYHECGFNVKGVQMAHYF